MEYLLVVIKNLRNGIMVNFIHCPECLIISEITSEDEEIIEEPKFCPYCGHTEEEDDEIDIELDYD